MGGRSTAFRSTFPDQRLIRPARDRARVEVPRFDLGQDLPSRVLFAGPAGGEGARAGGYPLLTDFQLVEFFLERRNLNYPVSSSALSRGTFCGRLSWPMTVFR